VLWKMENLILSLIVLNMLITLKPVINGKNFIFYRNVTREICYFVGVFIPHMIIRIVWMIQLRILVIHYVQKNFKQGKNKLSGQILVFQVIYIDVHRIIGCVMLLMFIVPYSGNTVD
jgi:hypothetical protein